MNKLRLRNEYYSIVKPRFDLLPTGGRGRGLAGGYVYELLEIALNSCFMY